MIYVYYLDVDAISEIDYQYVKKNLPDNFKKRVSGELIKKKESLLGRCLLHVFFSKLNNLKTSRLVFKLHKTGKIYIENQLPFNISHTGSCVALAISSGINKISIGVDIEKYREISNINSLVSYFTKEEQGFLLQSQDKNNQFLKIWTRKEAFYKALGTGIYNKNSLNRINCLSDTILHSDESWFFKSFLISQDYVGSCATNKSIPISLKSITPHEILASLNNTN